MDCPCTLTTWRVTPSNQHAFSEAIDRLEAVLLQLADPPGSLTLLQSIDDPAVFHTIGWFRSQADLDAMREHQDARRLLGELVRLSSEFHPTSHIVVRTR